MSELDVDSFVIEEIGACEARVRRADEGLISERKKKRRLQGESGRVAKSRFTNSTLDLKWSWNCEGMCTSSSSLGPFYFLLLLLLFYLSSFSFQLGIIFTSPKAVYELYSSILRQERAMNRKEP